MRFFDRFRSPGGLSCRQVQQLVQSYLDGELHGPEVDKLTAHLHQCERCGVEAETYRRIKAALGSPAPPRTIDRLRDFALAIPANEDPAPEPS